MTKAAWFNFPRSFSRVFALTLFELLIWSISSIHFSAFSFGRDTRILLVSIIHPKNVFTLDNPPSAMSLIVPMISDCSIGSDGWTGQKNK